MFKRKGPQKSGVRSKIIAIKKNEDYSIAANYRPISLLFVCYICLELLLPQCANPTLEDFITVEQAGFRKRRSTCHQVLALTTFVENGLQQNLKKSAIFLDLSAAHDTVWHTGLFLKLPKVLPHLLVELITLLHSNRRFRVHVGNKCSSWRHQENGLPQESVLSACLFNVYINDLPSTRSRKFIYADDICLATQDCTFTVFEDTFNEDLDKVAVFLSKWRLQPSVPKHCFVFFIFTTQRLRKA